jgi:hypothetical protein
MMDAKKTLKSKKFFKSLQILSKFCPDFKLYSLISVVSIAEVPETRFLEETGFLLFAAPSHIVSGFISTHLLSYLSQSTKVNIIL